MHIFLEKLVIVIMGLFYIEPNQIHPKNDDFSVLNLSVLHTSAKPQTHKMTTVLTGHLVIILDQRATINLFYT